MEIQNTLDLINTFIANLDRDDMILMIRVALSLGAMIAFIKLKTKFAIEIRLLIISIILFLTFSFIYTIKTYKSFMQNDPDFITMQGFNDGDITGRAAWEIK